MRLMIAKGNFIRGSKLDRWVSWVRDHFVLQNMSLSCPTKVSGCGWIWALGMVSAHPLYYPINNPNRADGMHHGTLSIKTITELSLIYSESFPM
jgi:hypothetical protein